MLTASQLVTQACEDAHAPQMTAIGQNKLQIILDEICFKHDFALARGVYYFALNPANITTIGGIQNFGGPYPLPLDFLRVSGSHGSEGWQYAFFYVYNGVPYPMQPWDMGRMDMQVQQPGIQNLPYAYSTDMSPETTAADLIKGVTTAATTNGSNVITVASAGAGSTAILVGDAFAGLGIPPGAQVGTIVGTTVTLVNPQAILGGAANCTGTFSAASVMYGQAVNLFLYPGPSGAFPATLRYQRLMPPLQDFTRVPWFPDQQFLLDRLTAEMCVTVDDTRHEAFEALAARRIGEYSTFADDKTSHPQRVMLDRQRFGRAFSRLPNTKTVGW